jgi:hypothetical protein
MSLDLSLPATFGRMHGDTNRHAAGMYDVTARSASIIGSQQEVVASSLCCPGLLTVTLVTHITKVRSNITSHKVYRTASLKGDQTS